MNILYLSLDNGIPVLGAKGASVHVRSFVTALAALGHTVVLACSRLGEGDAPPPARLLMLAPEIPPAAPAREWYALGRDGEPPDEPLLRRELARLAHDRTLPRRLLAALGLIRFRTDLIYERQALFYCAGAALTAGLGIPRVLEVNAPLVEEQARFRGLRLEPAARAREADSYRGAEAIVAVSAAVAAHVRSVLGDSAPVHVVPNGVDLARYDASADGAGIRARLGLGAAPVIGFVGSFKPWHGAPFLFEVFRRLAQSRPELRLIAVGEGPELQEMRARVAEYGLADRVALPGRVAHSEIPAWLAAMDITVAPYLPQPDFYFSPLKIVESLAAGRPVVAPRLGQIAELVEHRRTGLLYTPGEPVSCTAALRTLLDAPARRCAMGEAARQRVAGFGWEDVARRALALVQPEPALARRFA